MDRATLDAYDIPARAYADDWQAQPPPSDLYALLHQYFALGRTADIGCGSGREVAWLNSNGFPALGYDASQGLLAEARRRHSNADLRFAELPALDGIAPDSFDNVLCEAVIMHLPREMLAPSVRRLVDIVRPNGVLYLSWRVTKDADQRDKGGRLYAAFDRSLVRNALAGCAILYDKEIVSVSSGKVIHVIIARKAQG
jgi:SAM-dependent methyltransferase